MPGQSSATLADRTPARPATRWPRPDALSVVLFLGWVAGILFSTVVPYLLLPPTTADPDPRMVGTAFGASLIGIAVFAASGIAMSRHLRNQSILVFALVPVVSIGSGAVILTATLLGASMS